MLKLLFRLSATIALVIVGILSLFVWPLRQVVRHWPSRRSQASTRVGESYAADIEARRMVGLRDHYQAGPHVPAPLPGRAGCVGGVESIVIEDTRYFFGFSYSEDAVLSPLIDDKQVMAEFAAAYMKQRDGVAHDVGYWLEIVECAVTESGLCDDDDRRLTAAKLRAFVAALDRMGSCNEPSTDLRLDHHILYLVHACGVDADGERLAPSPELARLGLRKGEADFELDGDEVEALFEMGRGVRATPRGATYADVSFVIREYLRRVMTRLPGNWSLLLAKFVN